MLFATNRSTYPPYNPDSGGATGGSLLGSSLAVVAIFYLTPVAMRLRPRHGWRAELPGVVLLALHFAWFAALDHGNRSHHEWLQIVSLASLLVWPLILTRFFRRFDWPSGSRPWLASLLVWGTLLVATGVPMFLPGVLERIKFTSVLVGHAHLAMAGMCSSYVFLVLIGLLCRTGLAALFSDRLSFGLWHAGNALHIASLVALGWLEGRDAGALFEPAGMALALPALRVVAGVVVAAATTRWLAAALRRRGGAASRWLHREPQAEAA
jgi:cytochrome c oxidase cbb3-type subunit 1